MPAGVTSGQAQNAVTGQSQDQSPPRAVSSCPLERTWIEFRLLDVEGNPVSGKKYRIKLPDGAIVEGVLGKSGSVRLDGIVPGTCTIAFPEIDADAWERI